MADVHNFYFIGRKFSFLLLFVLHLVCLSTQDIVGCGGFLKSQVSLDFSKVNVKLYTKQGALKESSDCAPTNGYYFIPIYDKGEYVLKIEPPIGWHLEPKEVALNFDGVNDPCSKQNDINFVFKGFAILGKVLSKGRDKGPDNLKVVLTSQTDKTQVKSTLTTKNGYFQFTPILPDKYIVSIEHESYLIAKKSVNVHVKDGNLEVPTDALIVAGYDVFGKVLSNGEPIKGVNLILYGTDEVTKKLTDIKGCLRTALADLTDTSFICHLGSDANGSFHFRGLPPGGYSIRSHYVKFDVQPKKVDVVIEHDHVHLETQFVVKGFSISGSVLTRKNGVGVGQAQVFLDGGLATSTDNNGRYTVDKMEPGTYLLSVQADNMRFPEVTVKISPNTPEVETMYVSKLKLCGRVVPGEGHRTAKLVELKNTGDGTTTKVETQSESGEFCQYLPPGQYDVSVLTTDHDRSIGLQYVPAKKAISLIDKPNFDVEFSQLKNEVGGEIVRLKNEEAKDMIVKLKSKNNVLAVKTVHEHESSYVFTDVAPGTYEVEVQSSDWCVEKPVHTVVVPPRAVRTTVPQFVQNGYKMRILTSHDGKVILKAGKDIEQPLELERGENIFCVPVVKTYRVEPRDCHGYEHATYNHTIGVDPLLRLDAVTHEIGGAIISKDPVNGLFVQVTSHNGDLQRLGPLKGVKQDNGLLSYEFSLKSKENMLLKFVPSSESMVFRPESVEYRTVDDCSRNVLHFSTEKGLIVEGSIKPPLAKVKVTLRKEDGLEMTYTTTESGKFSFGPLKNTDKYILKAEKESYVMTGPDSSGDFTAHKLAKINVKVVDAASNVSLQGVLLSLTGGERYRKNSMTAEDGAFSFHSLSPGEYFLRPMMKEYKFDPASQIIQVQEGATRSVNLRGRRIAFSAFGTVTSLNGEPEANVLIEAVGVNACSNLQEEGSSEQSGAFRIRGLLPECEYTVRIKEGAEANAHVHRLEPSGLVIKTFHGDVKGLKLIAFQLMEQTDLSVVVESTTPEHIKSLKLKLCKEDQPDAPVYTVRLDSLAGGSKNWGNAAAQERFLRAGLLVQLPFVPRDRTPYFIQLESSLSKHLFGYKEPVVHFLADKTYRNLRMEFSAAPRTMDQEFSQGSYLVAPTIVLVALVYLYSNKITPLANRLAGMVKLPSGEKQNYDESSLGDAVSIEAVPASSRRRTKPRKT